MCQLFFQALSIYIHSFTITPEGRNPCYSYFTDEKIHSLGFQNGTLSQASTYHSSSSLLPLLAPSLCNFFSLKFPRTPPWVLFSSHSVSSHHANNTILISRPVDLHTQLQSGITLNISKLTRSKIESSSLCSLPPKNIFPFIFHILVNGTFIHPPVSNVGFILDTFLLYSNLNTKFQYFC